MTKRRLPLVSPGFTFGPVIALVLALAFLACGPAAEAPAPGGGQIPLAAQGAEATPEATDEPVFHTKTPPPTPPDPLPTKTPVPVVPPTSTPLPVHPQGIEGCKSAVMFQSDDLEGFPELMDWCMEQLTISVGVCLQESSSEAQRQCGEDIADEYRSYYLRYSSPRCAAVKDSVARHECRLKSNDDFAKALGDLYGAWEKVRIGAEGAPAVAEAWKDTITCLEGQGFKDINRDLLFAWQRFNPPAQWEAYEKGLSQEDKELRFRMYQPARDCAKMHGLFDAQDVAWAKELRRLDQEEPELVGGLINEGLLEALEKPGTARFLGGNVPEGDASSR